MGKRRKLRVAMDFDKPQPNVAATCMGIAFFLRIVYYLGFTRTEAMGFGKLLMLFLLPLALEIAFMVMLRGLKRNAPTLYGIMGVAYCLLLIVGSFWYGNVPRTVLAVIAYALCGAGLYTAMNGLLEKRIAATACFVTLAIRLLAFSLGEYILAFRLIAFLPEAAALCAIAALGFLPLGTKIGNKT